MSKKATEEQFNKLHSLLTKELTARINKGADCPTADLKAAIDWLSKNNITGVATEGSPLERLFASMEDVEITEEDLERAIR
jgi:hypothetical protein